MLANHTGLLKVPLVSGTAGDNPSLTAGVETTFALANLPAEKDGLANYLLGLVVYISGNFVQAGGAGSLVAWEDLIRCLVASFSVRNCWHGTPVNSAWVLGSDVPLWSYVLNGYRYVQRVPRQIPAANGTYPFNLRLFVPLSCGVGKKPHHTAHLALMYKDGIFGMNVAAASVGTGLSTGSSITGLNVRATAMCLLEPEVRLGPAGEIVDYTSPTPAAAAFDTRFQDFANNTGIAGTEKGAGIVWAMLRSSVRGGGGPVDFSTLTRIAVPFRGQAEISDVASYIDECNDAIGGPQRIVAQGIDSSATGAIDTSGYPNIVGGLESTTVNLPIRATTLLGFPLVNPANELELSKVQRVDETIVVSQTYSGAPAAGNHHLLAYQLREWTPEKKEQWRELVISSGLAKKVLGDVSSFDSYVWETKLMNKQDPDIVEAKKLRFLPLRLANAEGQRPGA
jgi:hypothetical protein